MIYNLAIITNQQRFKRRCNDLYEKRHIVELKTKKARTVNQNSYLHLILTWFAMETGNSLEFVKREYFKILCNPDIFVTEKICQFTGAIIYEIRSSATLPTDEMTTAIERFRNWSADVAKIYLPQPNEQDFLQQIEIEASRNEYV